MTRSHFVRLGLLFFLLQCVIAASTASAGEPEDWPQFRGPGGQGDARDAVVPLEWGGDEHIAWSAEIPGKGFSSPVVSGGRVWLTTAVEFEPTDAQKQATLNASRLEPKDFGRRQVAGQISLRVLCLDQATGRMIYDSEVAGVESPEAIHVGNSYASPTPVVDDGRVYAHFGVNGTVCVDAESGDVIWKRSVPVFYSVGVGSSPIIYQNLLVLVCDGIDQQFIIALDKRTGETVWQTQRPPMRAADGQQQKAYSTPLLVHYDGRDQLVIPGAQWVVSYEPLSGREIWRADHGEGFSTIPRPVFGHGMVYVCTGYGQSELWAIRVDGQGDVTQTHVAWKAVRQISKNPSPLLVDDLLFVISDTGIATCFNALTGEAHWQQRIGGNHSASPVAASGHVFFCSHEGDITAVKAAATESTPITSHVEGELKASPAVLPSSVIFRAGNRLYCIR